MSTRVETKIFKMLCVCFLSILGCFVIQMPVQAEVRDISLENGDRLYDSDYDDYFDSQQSEYISESDLFLVGDTGRIIPCTDWEEPVTITVRYLSSDASVVRVDEEGNYEVLKEGVATVTVTGLITSEIDEEGEFYEEEEFSASCLFQVGGDVSLTTLKNTTVQAYMIDQGYGYGEVDDIAIPFLNAPDLQYCSFQVVSPADANDEYLGITCRLDKTKKTLVVSSIYNKGTIDLIVRLNKKTFTVKIKISVIKMKTTSALLSYRGKIALKVTGYPGKIKWISSNKKVATVSDKGYVKAKKKAGNTVVYAQVGNHRLGCAVSVISPKIKKVIRKARKIAKTCKYSQAKRMSDKYYDCSSLVWKSYHSIGKTFGNAHYAPVAADIAKWCAKKKKVVKGGASARNIRKMKLKPGDLMFGTGDNNNRYRGIYHVEMFIGYRCYGFDKNRAILEPCWANRPDGYGTGADFVCRP